MLLYLNMSKQRILAIEAVSRVNEEILMKGFLQRIRLHGKIAFFDLRDRSGIIQVVATDEKVISELSSLQVQSVVEFIGKVKERGEKYINENIPTGKIEVEVLSDFNVISKANEMPFDMGGESLNLELPTLLDNRSLVLRHQSIFPIFKVQQAIVEGFKKTLKEEGFTEIFVPTLVPSATEGGAEVFKVNYYDYDAYLAQSPQFYKQIMVSSYERVFTIAHAYRAEPSVTTRHLSEYVSMDAEFGFINSWTDIMDMAEKTLKGIFNYVSENCKEELKSLGKEMIKIENDIPRIKLSEAHEIVFERTGSNHKNEPDLDPSEEAELCKWAEEKHGSPFVFITHYPTSKRPFYTMPDPKNSDLTLSFDLLGIKEEWFTGSQRINDYEMLTNNIKKIGGEPSNFDIYLQAFKYGMPAEGGFAIGLERLTKDILGLSNVREASLFPRDMERVDVRLKEIQQKNK
jgi:nondiscriminating aspartyl-tRNA synthetase